MVPAPEVPAWGKRIAAFGLDCLLIVAYLAVLATVGSAVAFGPTADRWRALVSSPGHADLIAFGTTILPVVLYFALLEGSPRGGTWGKRRMHLRVVRAGSGRLGRTRALVRSAVKFLPWQLAHTCVLRIPGWPVDPQEPPPWVVVGMSLVWVLIGAYLVALAARRDRRTPYDWVAGSQVVAAPQEKTAGWHKASASVLGEAQAGNTCAPAGFEVIRVARQLSGSIAQLSVDQSDAVRAVINVSNRSAYRSVIPKEYFSEEVLPADAMPELFEKMTFFGYWHEDRLAGVAALTEEPDKTARMRWVYVHPEFQRMGVGTALVRHLEEVARRAGSLEMTLRTAEGAHWAISFYGRLGYRVTGTTPRPWGADVWMSKDLRPDW